MPNYQFWDLVDEFTIYQAACLWCEIEPGISRMSIEMEHPEVQAVMQLLEMAVRNGDLEANTDREPSYGVRRSGLRALAESKGQRPVFLFPEDRPTAQRSTASKSKAHSGIAKLRPRLKEWIEKKAGTENAETFTKNDFLTSVREELDQNISQNMFNEVWRSADIPDGFKRQGRRTRRQ